MILTWDTGSRREDRIFARSRGGAVAGGVSTAVPAVAEVLAGGGRASLGEGGWAFCRAGGEAALDDLGAAEVTAAPSAEELRAGTGPAVLADGARREVVVALGREAAAPAFLLRVARDRVLLVSGAAALRAAAAGRRPDPMGINAYLAFGHPAPGDGLLDGVRMLLPGDAARIATDGSGAVGIAPLPAPEPVARDPLGEDLAARVAGRSVAIVAGAAPGWGEFLTRALRDLGASRVSLAARPSDSGAVSVAGTSVLALAGVPVSDPGLLLDVAAAAGAEAADVVLLDWGAETHLLGHAAYPAILRDGAAGGIPRSLFGRRLRIGGLVRDAFLDHLGVFPDEDRFAIIGSALFAEGFVAMADRLGLGMEGAVHPLAAVAGADAAWRLAASARPALLALQAMTGGRAHAPFLDPGAAAFLHAAGPHAAARLAALHCPAVPDGTAKLPHSGALRDRVAAMLRPGARLYATGLVARTPPVERLAALPEDPRTQRRALALFALEKWLRTLDA